MGWGETALLRSNPGVVSRHLVQCASRRAWRVWVGCHLATFRCLCAERGEPGPLTAAPPQVAGSRRVREKALADFATTDRGKTQSAELRKVGRDGLGKSHGVVSRSQSSAPDGHRQIGSIRVVPPHGGWSERAARALARVAPRSVTGQRWAPFPPGSVGSPSATSPRPALRRTPSVHQVMTFFGIKLPAGTSC
jgi:hypothetical protein